jgi:hypothetical protein
MSAPAASVRVGSLGVAATALAGLYFLNPNTTHVPLCPLHSVTGVWCPFCGSTRAAYALLHEDFATAIRDNVLFVVAVPILLILAGRWLAGRPAPTVPRCVSWAGVALLIGFGIARNLPFGAGFAP